jgi:hypothetical protein
LGFLVWKYSIWQPSMAQHTKTRKNILHILQQNKPNCNELCTYTKWPWKIPKFLFARFSKNYQNCNFQYPNIPTIWQPCCQPFFHCSAFLHLHNAYINLRICISDYTYVYINPVCQSTFL